MFIRLNLKDYGRMDIGIVFRKLFADIYTRIIKIYLWRGELAHDVYSNIYIHPVVCVLIRVECPVHTEQLT